MSTRRSSTEVHEFNAMFQGFHAYYKVTSVIGHVFSVDFPAAYQDWTATDPLSLFHAPVVKTESNPKAHIRRHLSQEARGCRYLVLWLDCDREGENICFEVIDCTGFHSDDGMRVYRARFSSVNETDISKAMNNLVEPNRDEALAVDARQEIDLKVGVAFTRFQTSYFQGKYGNLDSSVISIILVFLLIVYVALVKCGVSSSDTLSFESSLVSFKDSIQCLLVYDPADAVSDFYLPIAQRKEVLEAGSEDLENRVGGHEDEEAEFE
ncbi:hypothetical protein RJ640_023693 [Escallonia rubra]|uniref:DNA topoisomerase n=1 Tax=Escallonia rubra TaxID=112253 RepID=A0AA88QY96_9ASTE|nr:hypothetical protein RJ640_023693 [Escallonia rubra]